jgi:hypothetical protein
MNNIFHGTIIKLRILRLVSYAKFNGEKCRYENGTEKVTTSFKKVWGMFVWKSIVKLIYL